MRLPRVRGQPLAVRRPLLPDRHPVHRLRPRGGFPFPMGGFARRDEAHRLDRDDDLPRRTRFRARIRLEEGCARMGVMLSPGEDSQPTEEEIARAAGLTPGDVDMKQFEAMRSQLDEKGFLVTTTEDLFTWARTGSLWWMT